MNGECRIMNKKINSFRDLHVWQEGHKLVLSVYKITERFPKNEIFGLVSQMRRCAVSATSNIAEGFGRRGYKEKVQFYYLANGSLIELKNQLIVARDVGFITEESFKDLWEQSELVHKLLQGLIKSSKKNYS